MANKQLFRRLAFGSMGLLMLILIFATLFEKFHSKSFAIEHIYHSPFFIVLWCLLAVSAIIYIIGVSKRRTLFFTHISLITILIGAFTSFLTSKHGEITLAKDCAPASMFTTAKGKLEKLPFRLELTQIDTCYIDGTTHHSDYKAHIIISDKANNRTSFTASLNKPIRIKGYSFCIKEISDNRLSLITSYDPFGKPISNAGYLMTIISFILLFIDKKSSFNSMLTATHKRITYKSILVIACTTVLVIYRIVTFSGNDAQPILRTPLLGLHISAIITAYALIGYTAINAIVALCSKKKETKTRLAVLGRIILYPATMLLITGIFIGAVWADVSWGRYWGWDPKEVWALLTLLVCSITFHTRSLPFISKPEIFHIYSIVIFIIMLFSYFGVNYLLSGLHSYA